jgi:hypothetical protein
MGRAGHLVMAKSTGVWLRFTVEIDLLLPVEVLDLGVESLAFKAQQRDRDGLA